VKKSVVTAYPTESFFALGVPATDAQAIKNLFKLKKREVEKPIALIAASLPQVKKFFVMSVHEEKLAKQYWPGPLTILLTPKKSIAARALGAKKIGVRVPAHGVARRLALRAAAPLTATSANRSGQSPTKSVRALKKEFPDILVVSGRCGRQRQPSTIVEMHGARPRIIRQGAIQITS